MAKSTSTCSFPFSSSLYPSLTSFSPLPTGAAAACGPSHQHISLTINGQHVLMYDMPLEHATRLQHTNMIYEQKLAFNNWFCDMEEARDKGELQKMRSFDWSSAEVSCLLARSASHFESEPKADLPLSPYSPPPPLPLRRGSSFLLSPSSRAGAELFFLPVEQIHYYHTQHHPRRRSSPRIFLHFRLPQARARHEQRFALGDSVLHHQQLQPPVALLHLQRRR